MTHNLVPNFILEKFADDERNGRFTATALFVDISGFSAVTAKLMVHGQHGAEVLAGVMGAIFEPLINAVYSQGGFVTGFAGDAFTAVFPQPIKTSHQALAAAVAIQEQMRTNPEQATPYGSFVMSAKVGLALGEVVWGIVSSEDDQRASYYFQGTAIDGSASAEHSANPGDIIIDAACFSSIQDRITAEPVGDYYKLLTPIAPLPTPQKPSLPDVDLDQTRRFIPEAAIQAGQTGEFRQVVNVFISLPTVRTEAQLEIFMQTVFKLEQRYDGLLQQLDYGDKGANLLLFWGAPTAHENDVQRALHFILDLQTQTAIPINGGITYHVAHAGYIGSSLRGEYTCYGKGVNLAARFMTSASRGEIWVDSPIARLAGMQFDLEYEGQKTFKGFTDPQKVYILFERKDNTDTLFDGHIVGREMELSKLAEFVTPIYSTTLTEHSPSRFGHSPGMMVIWGEPGAGKSRLAHEFLTHYLHPNANTQVFLAQSDEILRQSLNPFRYWLKRYFGISEGLAESRNKRSFNRKLDRLIAEIKDQELAEELDQLRSFLAALVRLHWSDSAYEQVDAKSRQDFTFASLNALLQAESYRNPVILLLEDAHWMDRDSAAFLSLLLKELGQGLAHSHPIAVLATARYQGNGLSLEQIPFEEINLSQLSKNDLKGLAEALLNALPANNLLNLLVDKAEGNPFFAEQILRYLQEKNQLELVNGHWEVIDQAQSPLPENVNALLVARLDGLAHQVREIVQTAAILGREFEVRLLSEMLKDPTLPDKIAQVEQESIWSALSEIRYIFRHALLQETAYRMQLRARRQSLHKLAMEALESLYADDLSSHYGELAYHALSGDLTESAFQYNLNAGNEAMQRYAAAEAIAHYRPAMRLLEQVESTTDQRQQLCTVYGRAIELSGNPGAALAHYESMEKFALKINDSPLELTSLVAQGTIRATGNIMGNLELAESLGQKALNLAGMLNDEASQARVLWNLVNVYRQSGRDDEALAVGERSFQLAKRLNLTEQMAYTANDLMKVFLLRGEITNMLSYGDQALLLWRDLQNPPMLADTLTTYSSAFSYIGEFEKALELFDEALAICRETNNLWGEAYAYYVPVIINIVCLDIESGLNFSSSSLALAKKVGASIVEIYMHIFQSLLYLVASDFEKAKKSANKAINLVVNTDHHLIPQVKGSLALIYTTTGEMDKAAELIEDLPFDFDNFRLNLLLLPEKALGFHLLHNKAYNELLTMTTKVITKIEQYQLFILMADFYYLQGHANMSLGNLPEARRSLERGLTILRDSGGRLGFLKLATLLADIEEQVGNRTTANELRAEIESVQSHLAYQASLVANFKGSK